MSDWFGSLNILARLQQIEQDIQDLKKFKSIATDSLNYLDQKRQAIETELDRKAQDIIAVANSAQDAANQAQSAFDNAKGALASAQTAFDKSVAAVNSAGAALSNTINDFNLFKGKLAKIGADIYNAFSQFATKSGNWSDGMINWAKSIAGYANTINNDTSTLYDDITAIITAINNLSNDAFFTIDLSGLALGTYTFLKPFVFVDRVTAAFKAAKTAFTQIQTTNKDVVNSVNSVSSTFTGESSKITDVKATLAPLLTAFSDLYNAMTALPNRK